MEESLVHLKTNDCEIAFFGGSFTAIDKQYMIQLLSTAYSFVKAGKFSGIRVSTRPDCIDVQILDILKSYGVVTIELGCQSMIDSVLLCNKRGHTSEDIKSAALLIKSYGFSLGLQMMTGLYGSTPEDDLETARQITSLKPDFVRIYPTVVLKDTLLAELYQSGEYIPQTVDEAVDLCKELLLLFENTGIPVIRIGLHSSETIKNDMLAGAFHPAIRELCESSIIFDYILNQINEKKLPRGEVVVSVNPKNVSKALGQKRCNAEKLLELGYKLLLKQDKNLPEDCIMM